MDIYLDNSMTTRPSEKSVSQMLPYYTKKWGTPSAPHRMGQELLGSMEESLKAIYTLLGAKVEDDFVFTSSGAEAVNQVIQSVYREVTIPTGKNHYITSQIDEAPAIMAIGRLERFSGCVGTMVKPTQDGVMTAATIAEVLTPRTALVSLSWGNGLTGTINHVEEIAALCKLRGVKFHLDASHILGKLFYDLEAIGVDFLTFNGDLLHAPKGTGGILIRNHNRILPLITGGNEQAGHRAGTMNVPALIALGYAAKETIEARDFLCVEVARLKSRLEHEILHQIPEAQVLFHLQERLPHCTSLAFPGVSSEALLFLLNQEGVYACMGGGSMQQIGYLLNACGVDPLLANSALSFSLSRETTDAEIDQAVRVTTEAVHKLKNVSTHILKGEK